MASRVYFPNVLRKVIFTYSCETHKPLEVFVNYQSDQEACRTPYARHCVQPVNNEEKCTYLSVLESTFD